MNEQHIIKKKRRKVVGFNYWTMRRATDMDLARMWRRLWGDVSHGYVKMQWDAAEERGNELMDMCEGLHVGQSR